MTHHIAPILQLLATLTPLLHTFRFQTVTVTDVGKCCAVATILKRSFFIYSEIDTGNECTVGRVIASDLHCNTSHGKVRIFFCLNFKRLMLHSICLLYTSDAADDLL